MTGTLAPRHDVLAHAAADVARAGDLHLDHYGAPRPELAVVGGDGVWTDVVVTRGEQRGSRRRLLDASGSYASACLGAGHPAIRDGLLEGWRAGQATDEIGSSERSAFLDELIGPRGLLAEHLPGEYVASGRSSGSEGMELALRLVLESRVGLGSGGTASRAGRDVVIAFEGAWHGWTGGLLPLLNRRYYRRGLPAPGGGGPEGITVLHLPFGDGPALRETVAAHEDRLLAVVVEPVQGDAGLIEPPHGYLREMADLAASAGALLVADEVLTFARTGAPLAMRDADGPVPTDITVIGKSIGMGAIPLSVVIARRELTVRSTGAVATNDLRPLACSVARHGLRYIQEHDLFRHSAERGHQLRALLQSHLVDARGHLFSEVRGRGLLLGVELTERAAQRLPGLRRALADHGVLVEFMAGAGRRSRGHRYVFPTLRVVPPLTITAHEVDDLVARLGRGADAFDVGTGTS